MADPQFTPEEIEREEWCNIAGYEGLYSVSSLGRVRRLRAGRTGRKPKGMLTTTPNAYGYPQVSLSRENKARTFRVHCLVAKAFLGPRPEGIVINHRDGVKANNRLSNLEYTTSLENSAHALRMGLLQIGDRHPLRRRPEKAARGEQIGSVRLTENEVLEIRRLHAEGAVQRHIARDFHVSTSAIHAIVTRKYWRHI